MMAENINDKNIILFENKKIRKQEYNGEWYYSIVDIIEILTESNRAKKYWSDLKKKLEKEESFEVSEKIGRLKMKATDGKMRETDCANRETIFRIIQSVPSPKAEPFKLWFAHLAEERIQEINNPELAIERARNTYLQKGYREDWVNARIKGIKARNDLTDEWKKRGAVSEKDFAILTNEISTSTFGVTTNEHKEIKSLQKEDNLRDNMSPLELALTTLAEVTTTELHKTNDSLGMKELKKDANTGGGIASLTRINIEKELGRKVVTSENANNFKKQKKLLEN